MTNFSVQTINPVKIEDYYLIQSDQCGVKERNSQMLISDEELKGKVGERRVYKTFLTLYMKSPFPYFLCILLIRTWIEAFTVSWEGWQAWGTEV